MVYYGLYWHIHHDKMVELAGGGGGIGERLAAILDYKPEGELDARFHYLRPVQLDTGKEWDSLRKLLNDYATEQRAATMAQTAFIVAAENYMPTTELAALRTKHESNAIALALRVDAWLDENRAEMEELHDEQCEHDGDRDRVPMMGRWQPQG